MSMRADFYVGRGGEWCGSIRYAAEPQQLPADVRGATTERAFRDALARMAAERDDGTWYPPPTRPWREGFADYVYAFDAGQVWGSTGAGWWPIAEEPE